MLRHGRSPPIDRAAFASRLQAAIDRNGLTYEEIARRAREHLSSGERLSSVSVWQYAKAKSFPRRISYVEALGKVLGVEPDDLLVERRSDFRQELADRNDSRPGENPPPGQIKLTDLGDGRAAVVVNADLPWPVALKVLEILKSTL
ncbi:MAG TPA: hypothetical protein VHK66_06205 [Microvirga sp.]|jgi:transcriptional regulator with XRE-family HTH domain|nr:hypothetical protein [Microvirga sp.]